MASSSDIPSDIRFTVGTEICVDTIGLEYTSLGDACASARKEGLKTGASHVVYKCVPVALFWAPEEDA